MKKYILTIFTILLLITSISSITYAWFTYVEHKSVATFEAGVLAVSVIKDNVNADYDIEINNLAYLDYENEFIINDDNMTNIMASSHRFDIILDENAPQAKANISFDESLLDSGIIYLVIYEGMDLSDSASLTTDYASIISSVTNNGSLTKAEEIEAIKTYNEQTLYDISQLELNHDTSFTFQVVIWGDYDEVVDQNNYLDQTYTLTMNVDLINSKGDFES